MEDEETIEEGEDDVSESTGLGDDSNSALDNCRIDSYRHRSCPWRFLVDRAKPTQAATQPVEVEVARVEQRDVPIYSEWVGTTEGMVNADIKAEVTGYLLRQNYQEGSFVKKGQLIFEIDPRPFQAAIGTKSQWSGSPISGTTRAGNGPSRRPEAQTAQANAQLCRLRLSWRPAQANQVKTQLDVNKYAPLADREGGHAAGTRQRRSGEHCC